MSYTSDHLAWQQRVGQEANAMHKYSHIAFYYFHRHYDHMFSKTLMSGSDMKFGGGEEKNPMLTSAVGLGYLKQPLRYLTGEDIQKMAGKTSHMPIRPGTHSTVELERQFNTTQN